MEHVASLTLRVTMFSPQIYHSPRLILRSPTIILMRTLTCDIRRGKTIGGDGRAVVERQENRFDGQAAKSGSGEFLVCTSHVRRAPL